MAIPFTFTNESITVIYQGKPHVVQKGQPQFINLRNALMEERWDDVPGHLTISTSLTTWAKGRFSVNAAMDTVSFDGSPLPKEINSRIISMSAAGKNPTALFLFYERLQRNPSMRSVEQLYAFLKHSGIPLTTDGCFLAYKGVKNDFTDAHTGKVDNRPGTVNKMSRNKISDDPREACHFGFHVGALQYAGGFSQRVVICKVDPEHVVCVPYDSSNQKMRVCEYKVIGNHGEALPDDIFDEAEDKATPIWKELEPEQDDRADEDDEAFNGENSDDEDTCGTCGHDMGVHSQTDAGPDHCVLCAGDCTSVEASEEETEEEEQIAGDVNTVEGVPAKKNQKLKIPKEFKKLVAMEFEDLMKQPLMALRSFATHGLQIIGASKIKGGKVELISQIIKVRGTATE